MPQADVVQILGYPTNVAQRQLRYGVGETGLVLQLNNNGTAVQSITINEVQ